MKNSLLTLCVIIAFSSKSQLFTFKKIDYKNGLSLSSVLSVSQDQNGFILIGTSGSGLQRYDGKIVRSINASENNEHHVTSILPTKKGVYFSSQYYGFFHYYKNKIKKVSNVKGFGDNLQIQKINETLCLIGERKILLLKNNKKVNEFLIPKVQQNSRIIQVVQLNNSLILIGDRSSYFINETKIIELNKWLNFKGNIKIQALIHVNNKLELFDFKNHKKIKILLNEKNQISTVQEILLKDLQGISVLKAFGRKNKLIILDSLNNLYHYHTKFRYIPKNHHKKDIEYCNVFIDINNDYWAATNNSGIFKISDEPFTKIELSPIYQNPLISFIFKNEQNDIILSDYNGQTYISSYKKADFEKKEIRIYSRTRFHNTDFFATNKGIYFLKDGTLVQYSEINNNSKIIFLFAVGDELFYCEENKGLFLYNSKDKTTIQIIYTKNASHIYTAQINKFKTKIYFGTNNGIFEYNLSNKKLRDINHKYKLAGSYSGVSVTDIYGTIWFSLDKEIIGITPREEFLEIKDKKYFNSTLFYNLNADDYGNLLIGTNVGITKLKVDHLGNVLNSFHYNNSNGFNGYETHMRSNFQSGKYIYMGTIEGLFSINTENLEKLPNPPKPFIYQKKQKNNSKFNTDEELIKINYLVINPKLNGIRYSYRLKGKSNLWSDLTNKTEAYFSNLSDQEYIFQVKSTYDGLNFSPVTNYNILKDTPLWRSKWFVLFLILSIALANIIVLDRSKSFENNQIIDNQNVEINSKIRSIILAFAFIAMSCSHFFASYADVILKNFLGLNISITFILFILFLLSISNHPYKKINKYLLQIALFFVISHSYLGAYLSNIHPIFVVVISICTAITPFVFYRIKEAIIFSIFHLISAISIVFLLENTIYHEVLFLIAIIVSICFAIFTTYIRNDSMQKLIFISEIINKGDVLALAFNKSNKITYISENSFQKFKVNPSSFLGKDISELNKFVYLKLSKEQVDFKSIFKDNNKHIIPMVKPDGSEIWIEWSCKIFSKSVKVIFGQDVTDLINLENNYESLIENAEDLIYTVDVNGKFLFVNTKFQSQLEYNEQELIGRNSLFIVGEKYETTIKAFYENQFQEKTLNTYNEFPIRKKDGSEIWVGQNTTILFASGSNKIVKGFLALARDITEKRAQQKLIETQNLNITSSINYAKKIQFNLLPDKNKFSQFFTEFDIFYHPKDIVSGDFFWLDEINDTLFLVVADCTGHGVPGSFMTLLGINLLNQIILEDKINDPGEILSRLDEKLIQVLPREGNSIVRDGLDMTIIALNKKGNYANYACAGGKFIAIENDEIAIKRGESKHIGDLPEANFSKYNTYYLDLSNISKFYFFTDGIQDQFGDITNKKFTLKRILEILKKNSNEPITTNIQEIKSKVNIWKGNSEQTDDITFIGFKL